MGYSDSDAQPGDGARRSDQRHDSLNSAGDERARMTDESFRDLLDEVLKKTLVSRDDETRERLESLEELLKVARRRRREAFSLDPVGIELVQSVLRTPFRALLASEDQWRAMTTQVARTLCEDPASYDRLSTLWRRLVDRCGNGN
jgi:hypothetical protein